jgi:iron complex transport system ATP-binding protein
MLVGQNISVRYGKRSVLENVSLELRSGEIVAMLGPNGAGKTTMLRALNGSVRISSGMIELDDKPLPEYSRREIAKRVAVVAQENETKFPLTVLDFVLAGRFANGSAFGCDTDFDIEAAMEALEDCDLTDFEGRLMNELSGGERQRVVLARAIATDAKVFLLDEPTANLDLAHQGQMFRLIRERCRDRNCAALVITHDLNLAAEFANELLMLKDGKTFAFGPPSDVLNQQNINEVYDVRVLLDANPASGKVRLTTVY